MASKRSALLLLLLLLACILGGAAAARTLKEHGRRHHHHRHHHHHREVCQGCVIHEVGDEDGWTDKEVDYDGWSWSNTFHQGDVIVFNYDKKDYKLIEVRLEDYRRCNTENPIKVYDSGHESFTISGRSHRYFIGERHSCLAGQKVNIRVAEATHPEETRRKNRRRSTASHHGSQPISSPPRSSSAIPPSSFGLRSSSSPEIFDSAARSSASPKAFVAAAAAIALILAFM